MDIKHPVNFNTYFYLQLLDTIKEHGKSKFEGNLAKSLESFLEYLAEGEDPLKNIERLAGNPETSDLSIYFADLIDKIKNDAPEAVIHKIDENALDFLEIFQVVGDNIIQTEISDEKEEAETVTSAASDDFVSNEIKKPIDFDTFYLTRLFEEVEKQGESLKDEQIKKNLKQFIDFLILKESPLVNIEKLAHYPATSDISIFFSDLLERNRKDTPDFAVKNINIIASDFVNMFKEMVKEPHWLEELSRKILAQTKTPDQTFTIKEFTRKEISSRIIKNLDQLTESKEEQITSLLNRFSVSKEVKPFLSKYKKTARLEPVIDLLETLLIYPSTSEKLNEFIETFNHKIDKLTKHLSTLSSKYPEIFAAFCAGEPIPAEVAPEEEEIALDKLVEKAQEYERPEIKSQETSEEEIHLRWLLHDYILHEIAEMNKELSQKLTKLSKHRDIASQTAVLDLMKVFKDFGQIHKYPRIEELSKDINLILKEFFKDNLSLSVKSVGSLERLCSLFGPYVTSHLEDKSEEAAHTLEAAKNEFIQSLTMVKPIENMVSFSEKDLIIDNFEEINKRFINRIRENFNQLVEKPERDKLQNKIEHQINHLNFWYEKLELEGGSCFANFLEKLFQDEKAADLIEKRELIDQIFSSLTERLLKLTEDDLLRITELQKEKMKEEPVDIKKSTVAFQEITLRFLKRIEGALENNNQKYKDCMTKVFSPSFQKIMENANLINHKDILNAAAYICEKIPLLLDIPEFNQNKFREGLTENIREIARFVSKLPDPMPVNEIINNWEKLYESHSEEPKTTDRERIETTDVGTPKMVMDNELEIVFQKEVEKHLDEINILLDKLKTDISDRKVLKKLGTLIHTIKGSAQMLGQGYVTELAKPLENIIDLILDGKVELKNEFIDIFREAGKCMGKQVEKNEIEYRETLKKLNDYVQECLAPEDSDHEVESAEEVSIGPEMRKIPGMDKSSAIDEEAGVLYLSEKDPELIDIFSSEALKNLEIIENDLTLIEKFTHDKKTLQSLDQAVHEVRAAAVMLGFSEIGVLTDDLEQLMENINKKEPQNWDEIVSVFRKVVRIVKDLTETHEVALENFEDAVKSVSSLLIKLSQEKMAVGTESELLEVETKPEKKHPEDQIKETFIQEAKEILEDINFILMKMEKDPENDELSYHLMRSLHTLKGSASLVYLEPVENLAHLCEDAIEAFRLKKMHFPQEAFDLFFEVVDEVSFCVDALEQGKEKKTRNFEELSQRFQSFYADMFQQPKSKQKQPIEEKKITGTDEEQKDNYLTITDELESIKPAGKDTYIRLHVSQMDNLLNEAAELVINHTQFKTQFERFKKSLPRMDADSKNLQNIIWYLDNIINEEDRLLEKLQPLIEKEPTVEETQKSHIENIKKAFQNLNNFFNNFNELLQGFKESGKLYEEQLHKITRLSTQIHEEIMQARLVPIALLFQRFNRPLRDQARVHNKKVNLIFEGENTELDRVLVEELYEPMLHILRNAVDHGIEPPEERKKAGKPEEGTIKLIATHERNFITILVQDDGRGIGVEKIRKRARELQLINEKKSKELSNQQLFEFLLNPGFTTSESATRLSGRGVGLDVVRKQIQKLKGSIKINSEFGKGTSILTRLPISLTVTQAMLVEISDYIYAIPLLQVEETIEAAFDELSLLKETYYLQHRGTSIPVLFMSRVLKTAEPGEWELTGTDRYPVIIVQDEGDKVALLVDRIIRREEILIKSLGPSLQKVPFITGGSVLADGKVVLVVDVSQVVRDLVPHTESKKLLQTGKLFKDEKSSGNYLETSVKEKKYRQTARGKIPSIMVVDDSLSIRKFLAKILTKHGFKIEMAKNGYEALEKLDNQDFDLIFTDLEMPQLSGYELIEKIRDNNNWKELPVLVLTGRVSKHIQKLAMNLGADDIITKPFKENELLEKIQEYIEIKSE